MKSLQADVARFQSLFNMPMAKRPTQIPAELAHLRKRLIEEESKELTDAIDIQDLVEIADGIADVIYVALGAALTFGIDMQPIWDEVQKTNMAKFGGLVREDGKILKPVGWKPPDIKSIIEAQQEHWCPQCEYSGLRRGKDTQDSEVG